MVRLLQMLWRLNFLVFFLVMIMDNHYILYYICPLHTFYFLMVYVIMRPVQSANYTKSGMRWKLALAALFISAVWDWDIGLFDKVRVYVYAYPCIRKFVPSRIRASAYSRMRVYVCTYIRVFAHSSIRSHNHTFIRVFTDPRRILPWSEGGLTKAKQNRNFR